MSEPVAVLRTHNDDGRHRVRLYLWCPGCEDLHAIGVEGEPPLWTFDGNLEAPTISPSIKVDGHQWDESYGFHKPNHRVEPGQPTCCHSFVKGGQWEFLGDCTHIFKGQTVLLTPPPGGWPWAEGTISDGQSQRPANAQPPQPTDDAIGAFNGA